MSANAPATPAEFDPRPLAERGGPFHIPSLDGIRAVAVMIVMAAHFGLDELVPGGYGVTVFFFLSGYLITTLMRREFQRSGKIDLVAFYLRRTLRIFPPMYLTLGLLMLLSLVGIVGEMFDWKAVLYQVFFLTNYLKILTPEYADTIAQGLRRPIGTGVYWSLAIEEHFYMLFPLLMMLLMPRLTRGRIALVLLGTCVLGLVWRLYLVYYHHVPHVRTYYGTDTRMDSIMFGCVLALWGNPYLDRPFRFGPWVRALLLLAAVGATLFTLFAFRDSLRFREGWRYSIQSAALLPIFYFAITEHRHRLFCWLDWRWLRTIGALSYTLYLVHLAVWLFVSNKWPQLGHPTLFALAAAVSFAYAIAMFYAVERPCAKLRKRLHQRTATAPAGPQTA